MNSQAQASEKLETFFSTFKRQQYKKGEILIRADDTPVGVFYLKSGVVREYAISKKGDELVANIYNPGSFFPMSWAITNAENSYYYEAITPVEVFRAPKEEVNNFIKNEPSVLYELIVRIYKGRDGLLSRLICLISCSAYGRLVTELISYAKRFGEKTDIAQKIEVIISEKDLAALAGLTRETVSRELKILKEKGIVTFNKHILVINNLEELEKEASM